MAERNKAYLKQEFRDGERPTGTDFADFIDSYVNKQDDGVSVDPVNKNLNIPAGITIRDVVSGPTGTLRFNAGNVQVFDGATWVNVGGAAGAGGFTPVAGGPSIAFDGGNVGLGAFAVAPTFKFEVILGPNTAEADRVRFGNVALSNGQGAFQNHAQFAHVVHADGNIDFALRQGPNGDVNLNAPSAQPISISHARTNTRVFVAPTGQVVIGNNALLPGSTGQVFQVNGDAVKTSGGGAWDVASDGRFKKDVMDFKDGLDKLLQVRPVRFKYDGLPGVATKDKEEVGIIGQEMQKIFPYMIFTKNVPVEPEGSGRDDVLMYNDHALTYVMVNAIQELAQQVNDLKAQLKEAKKK